MFILGRIDEGVNHLLIDTEKCIGCGKCARMCMKNNIVIENRKAKETGAGCLECSHCVSSCPKGAIRLREKEAGEGGRARKNVSTGVGEKALRKEDAAGSLKGPR